MSWTAGTRCPHPPAGGCNTGGRGGPAPARIYIPELLGDVLDGAINPGRVFDYETDLDHIADAYRAMDERRAIKSLVRMPSSAWARSEDGDRVDW